jgi:hypothetical protein
VVGTRRSRCGGSARLLPRSRRDDQRFTAPATLPATSARTLRHPRGAGQPARRPDPYMCGTRWRREGRLPRNNKERELTTTTTSAAASIAASKSSPTRSAMSPATITKGAARTRCAGVRGAVHRYANSRFVVRTTTRARVLNRARARSSGAGCSESMRRMFAAGTGDRESLQRLTYAIPSAAADGVAKPVNWAATNSAETGSSAGPEPRQKAGRRPPP